MIHVTVKQPRKTWVGYGLSQWGEALLCNAFSHWLSPYPKWPWVKASRESKRTDLITKQNKTVLGIILGMGSANEKKHYIVMPPLIGWAHIQNDPLDFIFYGMYTVYHDDIIKWKHFPCCWPFVRGIHWSLVNSPHKGQRRRALMFSLICARINGWVNNGEAGDLRRHRAHYDVTVMLQNCEDLFGKALELPPFLSKQSM